MTIAPIVKTVRTKAHRERAFALFAARMGEWWPKGKPSVKPNTPKSSPSRARATTWDRVRQMTEAA